jgi:hypothetical protein
VLPRYPRQLSVALALQTRARAPYSAIGAVATSDEGAVLLELVHDRVNVDIELLAHRVTVDAVG